MLAKKEPLSHPPQWKGVSVDFLVDTVIDFFSDGPDRSQNELRQSDLGLGGIKRQFNQPDLRMLKEAIDKYPGIKTV